jgi:hypothetical protein
MIKIYNQEELNKIFLDADKAKEKGLIISQTEEDYVSIFVDPKSNIIKQYVISSMSPESIVAEGLTTVHLGTNVSDESLTVIAKAEPTELSFTPTYDIDEEMLSYASLTVEGLNCTYDVETGKWSTKDGSKKYEFHIKVVDDEGKKSSIAKTMYIKHQEPGEDIIKINDKKSNKVTVKNFAKVTVENLTDLPQTFKVKCTLLNDESFLSKFLNIN